MSPSAAALIDEGRERSATIRGLTDTLQASDLIVFVELVIDPAVAEGRTGIMGATPSTRNVHVRVCAMLGPDRRLEILGHELQHAVEIARAPEVRDDASLQKYLKRVGRQLARRNEYETDAARKVELQVRRDLWQRKPLGET